MVIGPIANADVPTLCKRLRLLVGASGLDVVTCDVGPLLADIATVDALARLLLTARRLGCRVRLHHASRELETLVDFCGLGDVLALDRGGSVEERERGRPIEQGDDAPG